MLKDHDLVGAIAIYRQEVRPFTDKQIELVTELRRPGRDCHREHPPAQRAAPAHRRSGRIAAAANRDRRRAQGHQPLDLRSASRARHAGRIRRRGCATPISALRSTVEDDALRMQSRSYGCTAGLSAIHGDAIRSQPGADRRSGAQRSKASTVHIADVSADPEFHASHSRRELSGVVRCLASRCCARDEPLGVMVVYRAGGRGRSPTSRSSW